MAREKQIVVGLEAGDSERLAMGVAPVVGAGRRFAAIASTVAVVLALAGCGQAQPKPLAAHATVPRTNMVPVLADVPTPDPTPAATPHPSPTAVARASGGARALIRGIYRFSSEAWGAMAGAGFNAATDGGVNALGQAQQAAGIRGMVWVPAYDNSSCQQTMSDSDVTALVAQNAAAGWRGLTYQIGDEPTANGCAAAPTYLHLTALVHAADPRAKTWVADDQFNDPSIDNWPAGVPMKGTVDVLAFDVYPCQSGPCDYQMIDAAVQRIHQAGLVNWQFILQDFTAQSWRWPSSDELIQQFRHWQHQGASGYWVFAWDYQSQSVTDQAGNQAALQWLNRQPA